MKAFAGLAVTAGLIVAIPVANAQTSAHHDAGKSPHHAASNSNRPYFVMSLQTMLRHLLRPRASMSHVARRSVPLPPPEPTEVAAGPAEQSVCPERYDRSPRGECCAGEKHQPLRRPDQRADGRLAAERLHRRFTAHLFRWADAGNDLHGCKCARWVDRPGNPIGAIRLRTWRCDREDCLTGENGRAGCKARPSCLVGFGTLP